MAKGKHWTQRLADAADLAAEPVPGVTVVELAEDRRVLIERHQGVTEYCRERITVKVRFGCIAVCGQGLELNRMSKDQLVISGRIEAVQLCRRKG